ncbi:UvrD-helicase domain-containing protein [Dactylosporangium sp. NPDC000521]|uniref:UvrD-helicase domain-containing protein n=1 Tax=Dactylosporangium sp. NPDC000521 TaxID=3363975 RepID=UPI0036B7FCB5
MNDRDEITFSAAQRALIDIPGGVFVQACPGAGKTQSIVERFIQRPGIGPRHGVALLSFTNAAINEARLRCAGRPELLRAPNFIGTIDSFINRYVVTPLHRAKTGTLPTFKDSWETVQGTTFRANGVQSDLQLSWFSFDHEGKATFESKRAPYALRNLEFRQLSSMMTAATRTWRRYFNNGLMDCTTSRALMTHYLSDPAERANHGSLIAGRFKEIIVDEVQDCSAQDAFLLNFLLDAGIEMVMVGDLDQAIYAFRGSTVDGVRSLARRVRPGARFNANYRSSPAVCALVNSLRHGASVDVPAGRWATDTTPVQVVEMTSFGTARDVAVQVADHFGFEPSDIVTLAHTEHAAREGAGASPAPEKGTTNKLVRLANAAAAIQDVHANTRIRTQAVQAFESLIRGLADEQHHAAADTDFCNLIGLTHRAFREGIVRLANRAAPFSGSPSQFREQIRQGLAAFGWDNWADASALRSPNGNTWPQVAKDDADALRWSTIHSFKGLQAPVIAMTIPAPFRNAKTLDGVGLWQAGMDGEARRVLYVGASRAERLSILLVDASQYATVVACLQRDAVPFARWTQTSDSRAA